MSNRWCFHGNARVAVLQVTPQTLSLLRPLDHPDPKLPAVTSLPMFWRYCVPTECTGLGCNNTWEDEVSLCVCLQPPKVAFRKKNHLPCSYLCGKTDASVLLNILPPSFSLLPLLFPPPHRKSIAEASKRHRKTQARSRKNRKCPKGTLILQKILAWVFYLTPAPAPAIVAVVVVSVPVSILL